MIYHQRPNMPWFVGLLVTLLASSFGQSTSAEPENKTELCGPAPQKHIVCYYQTENNEFQIDDLNPCLCTHFIYGSIGLDSDTHFTDQNEDNMKSMKNLKLKNPDLKTLISIKDASVSGSTPLRDFASNYSKIDQLGKKLRRLVRDTNTNGIDIEWVYEYSNTTNTTTEKNLLTNFLKRLRTALDDVTLTLTTSKNPTALINGYDFKNISKYVDLINIPAFQFDQCNKSIAQHHGRLHGVADMENMDSMVDLLLTMGTNKEKIIIGIPTFGISYKLTNESETKPGSPVEYGKPMVMTHSEICVARRTGNWTLVREKDQTAPYVYKGKTWIGFDDEISFKLKSKYILLRNLGGVMVFTANQDDYRGMCGNGRFPLLRSIRDVLSNSKSKTNVNGTDELEEYLDYSESRVVEVYDHLGNVFKTDYASTDTVEGMSCTRQGYYRHPADCTRFYRCVKFNQLTDAFSIFQYDCPSGLVFDERHEVCNWPSWSPPCDGSGEILPRSRNDFYCPDLGYYRDPENCRIFFYCNDVFGNGTLSAYEFKCPYNLAFDEERLVCDWPLLVAGCAEKVGLIGVQNGYASGVIQHGGLFGGSGLVHTLRDNQARRGFRIKPLNGYQGYASYDTQPGLLGGTALYGEARIGHPTDEGSRATLQLNRGVLGHGDNQGFVYDGSNAGGHALYSQDIHGQRGTQGHGEHGQVIGIVGKSQGVQGQGSLIGLQDERGYTDDQGYHGGSIGLVGGPQEQGDLIGLRERGYAIDQGHQEGKSIGLVNGGQVRGSLIGLKEQRGYAIDQGQQGDSIELINGGQGHLGGSRIGLHEQRGYDIGQGNQEGKSIGLVNGGQGQGTLIGLQEQRGYAIGQGHQEGKSIGLLNGGQGQGTLIGLQEQRGYATGQGHQEGKSIGLLNGGQGILIGLQEQRGYAIDQGQQGDSIELINEGQGHLGGSRIGLQEQRGYAIGQGDQEGKSIGLINGGQGQGTLIGLQEQRGYATGQGHQEGKSIGLVNGGQGSVIGLQEQSGYAIGQGHQGRKSIGLDNGEQGQGSLIGLQGQRGFAIGQDHSSQGQGGSLIHQGGSIGLVEGNQGPSGQGQAYGIGISGGLIRGQDLSRPLGEIRGINQGQSNLVIENQFQQGRANYGPARSGGPRGDDGVLISNGQVPPPPISPISRLQPLGRPGTSYSHFIKLVPQTKGIPEPPLATGVLANRLQNAVAALQANARGAARPLNPATLPVPTLGLVGGTALYGQGRIRLNPKIVQDQNEQVHFDDEPNRGQVLLQEAPLQGGLQLEQEVKSIHKEQVHFEPVNTIHKQPQLEVQVQPPESTVYQTTYHQQPQVIQQIKQPVTVKSIHLREQHQPQVVIQQPQVIQEVGPVGVKSTVYQQTYVQDQPKVVQEIRPVTRVRPIVVEQPQIIQEVRPVGVKSTTYKKTYIQEQPTPIVVQQQQPQVVVHHQQQPQVVVHHQQQPQVVVHHQQQPQVVVHHQQQPQVVVHHQQQPQVVVHHQQQPQVVVHQQQQPQVVVHQKQQPQVVVHHQQQPQVVVHQQQPQVVVHQQQPQVVVHHQQPQAVVHQQQPQVVVHQKQPQVVVHQQQPQVVVHQPQPQVFQEVKPVGVKSTAYQQTYFQEQPRPIVVQQQPEVVVHQQPQVIEEVRPVGVKSTAYQQTYIQEQPRVVQEIRPVGVKSKSYQNVHFTEPKSIEPELDLFQPYVPTMALDVGLRQEYYMRQQVHPGYGRINFGEPAFPRAPIQPIRAQPRPVLQPVIEPPKGDEGVPKPRVSINFRELPIAVKSIHSLPQPSPFPPNIAPNTYYSSVHSTINLPGPRQAGRTNYGEVRLNQEIPPCVNCESKTIFVNDELQPRQPIVERPKSVQYISGGQIEEPSYGIKIPTQPITPVTEVKSIHQEPIHEEPISQVYEHREHNVVRPRVVIEQPRIPQKTVELRPITIPLRSQPRPPPPPPKSIQIEQEVRPIQVQYEPVRQIVEQPRPQVYTEVKSVQQVPVRPVQTVQYAPVRPPPTQFLQVQVPQPRPKVYTEVKSVQQVQIPQPRPVLVPVIQPVQKQIVQLHRRPEPVEIQIPVQKVPVQLPPPPPKSIVQVHVETPPRQQVVFQRQPQPIAAVKSIQRQVQPVHLELPPPPRQQIIVQKQPQVIPVQPVQQVYKQEIEYQELPPPPQVEVYQPIRIRPTTVPVKSVVQQVHVPVEVKSIQARPLPPQPIEVAVAVQPLPPPPPRPVKIVQPVFEVRQPERPKSVQIIQEPIGIQELPPPPPPPRLIKIQEPQRIRPVVQPVIELRQPERPKSVQIVQEPIRFQELPPPPPPPRLIKIQEPQRLRPVVQPVIELRQPERPKSVQIVQEPIRFQELPPPPPPPRLIKIQEPQRIRPVVQPVIELRQPERPKSVHIVQEPIVIQELPPPPPPRVIKIQEPQRIRPVVQPVIELHQPESPKSVHVIQEPIRIQEIPPPPPKQIKVIQPQSRPKSVQVIQEPIRILELPPPPVKIARPKQIIQEPIRIQKPQHVIEIAEVREPAPPPKTRVVELQRIPKTKQPQIEIQIDPPVTPPPSGRINFAPARERRPRPTPPAPLAAGPQEPVQRNRERPQSTSYIFRQPPSGPKSAYTQAPPEAPIPVPGEFDRIPAPLPNLDGNSGAQPASGSRLFSEGRIRKPLSDDNGSGPMKVVVKYGQRLQADPIVSTTADGKKIVRVQVPRGSLNQGEDGLTANPDVVVKTIKTIPIQVPVATVVTKTIQGGRGRITEAGQVKSARRTRKRLRNRPRVDPELIKSQLLPAEHRFQDDSEQIIEQQKSNLDGVKSIDTEDVSIQRDIVGVKSIDQSAYDAKSIDQSGGREPLDAVRKSIQRENLGVKSIDQSGGKSIQRETIGYKSLDQSNFGQRGQSPGLKSIDQSSAGRKSIDVEGKSIQGDTVGVKYLDQVEYGSKSVQRGSSKVGLKSIDQENGDENLEQLKSIDQSRRDDSDSDVAKSSLRGTKNGQRSSRRRQEQGPKLKRPIDGRSLFDKSANIEDIQRDKDSGEKSIDQGLAETVQPKSNKRSKSRKRGKDALPDTACTRPGLFRHPDNCNKFYECFYDKWLNKFTLHMFECPIKLAFDEGVFGCTELAAKTPCKAKRSIKSITTDTKDN